MRRRAAILGMGYMGTIRLAALETRGDCDIVRTFDGEDASWRVAVDDPAVDVVFVCLPSHLTCEAVCRALEAGKDVFAEKPPGLSVAEVRRMAAAEASSGRALKFGFNHRYHPAVRAAKRRIDENDLGEVLWLRGRYGKPLAPDFAESWRADRARAGGGIFIDQGIHMLDLMRMFAGELERAEAFASSSFSDAVEDDLVAILEAGGGALAILHSSQTSWQPIFSLEIGLRGGLVAIDGLLSQSGRYGPETLRWRTRDDPEMHVETFETDDSWSLELDELFECARTGTPVRVGSTADALQLMILVEAIYASAGRPLGRD
jgi:predicted dehydrogenase